MKILKEKYKTLEGANKRARLENALAPGEYSRGDKAKLYRYSVLEYEEHYRVARFVDTAQERLRHHVTGAIERGEKEAIVSKTD